MHNVTRIAGIFSPRRPELLRRVDLYRMLAAFRFPGASTTHTYFDDARGLAIGVVTPEGAEFAGWWQAGNDVLACEGRVKTPAGELRGTVAAAALNDALRAGTPLEELAGEFGFARWEGESGELTLGNDPYGRASLFYSPNAGSDDGVEGPFLFASELKAVLAHPRSRRAFSSQGIASYLQDGTIFPPFTAYDGVLAMRAGEVMHVTGQGRSEPRLYWQFPPPDAGARDLQGWSAEVGDRVRADILRHAAADGPTGVLFSAGFDSSIIVGVLKEAGADVRAVTAAYPSSFRSRPSDYLYASRTAEALGFPCDEVLIEPAAGLPVTIEALSALDQPNVQISSLITFKMLMDAVRPQGVDVCLTGMGTEEAYGIDFWSRILKGRAAGTITSDDDILRLAGEPTYFDNAEVERYLNADGAAILRAMIAPYEAIKNCTDAYDYVRRVYLWMVRRVRLLELTETLAVLDPIEVRHPFNEWTTLRFVETIPAEFKGSQDASMYKALLKQPFGYLVPSWVHERDSQGLPGFVISEYGFEALERYLFDPHHIAATGLFGGADMSKALRKRKLRRILTWLLLWHDIHVTQRQESLSILESEASKLRRESH